MQVKLIHCTPDAEKLIALCARVSSDNPTNPEYVKLLQYLIKHKHWSPYEMASMCVEIETTRGVAPQILRHRSFNFQERSLRYASAASFENYSARRQDAKNRQNSLDDLDSVHTDWFQHAQNEITKRANELYEEALSRGIAKECSRNLLTMGTSTTLFMHGTLRSWLHYIEVRCHTSTQKEHRDIALECKRIFTEQFPIIAEAAFGKHTT